MKKPLLFLAIFLPTILLAQHDTTALSPKKIIWGVQAGGEITNCSQVGNVYAFCTLDINNFSICFGPAFGPKNKITHGEGNPFGFGNGDLTLYLSETDTGQHGLTGFHILFQHNHLTRNSDVNERFFQYRFIYLHYTDDGDLTGYGPYKAKRSDTEHMLVYGYNFKITPHLYITPSIGIGIFFENTFVDFATREDYTDSFSLGDVIASIGLGYKFGNR